MRYPPDARLEELGFRVAQLRAHLKIIRVYRGFGIGLTWRED